LGSRKIKIRNKYSERWRPYANIIIG